jgi:hypothetical protein
VAVIVAEMRLDPVYKHPFAGKATGLDEEPFEMTWLFWEKLSNMNKIR